MKWLTPAEIAAATDGTIVWGLGYPNAGKPIGLKEMRRRKAELVSHGLYPSPKRPRPYIPLKVRVVVAERDVEKHLWWELYCSAVDVGGMTLGRRLGILLGHLPKGAQLDHDPALILRPFNERTGKYTPDANDPAYLIYREPAEHLQKTTGRKPGAERTITTKGSDIGIKTKFARLERKARTTVKPKGFGGKRSIPSRPFSTQKRTIR